MKKKEIFVTFAVMVWCVGYNAEVFEDRLHNMGIDFEEVENFYGDKTYQLQEVTPEQYAYISNLEEEGISIMD